MTETTGARGSISPTTCAAFSSSEKASGSSSLAVIALWLGHEELSTTHLYMTSSIEMKERALNALHETKAQRQRFRPNDTLLRFLDGL